MIIKNQQSNKKSVRCDNGNDSSRCNDDNDSARCDDTNASSRYHSGIVRSRGDGVNARGDATVCERQRGDLLEVATTSHVPLDTEKGRSRTKMKVEGTSNYGDTQLGT